MPTESTNNWSFFLSHFCHMFPSLRDQELKFTLINDRSKGLAPALIVEFLNALHAYYCYHLDENFMQFHSGEEVRNLF